MTETTSGGDSPVGSSLVHAGAGALDFAALAAATYVLFENAVLAVAVGGLSGVGMYLLLPYVLGSRAGGSESGTGGGQAVQDVHRGAAGMALSASGVLALGLMFVFEDPTLAVGAGVGIAALEYVALSRVLPRSGLQPAEG